MAKYVVTAGSAVGPPSDRLSRMETQGLCSSLKYIGLPSAFSASCLVCLHVHLLLTQSIVAKLTALHTTINKDMNHFPCISLNVHITNYSSHSS